MVWVRQRWVKGSRYYEAYLHQDLLAGLGADEGLGAAWCDFRTDQEYALYVV